MDFIRVPNKFHFEARTLYRITKNSCNFYNTCELPLVLANIT